MRTQRLLRIAGMIALCPVFMTLQSCDAYTMQVESLISAIPDAWDDSEDAMKEHAAEVLQECAADPDMLAKDTQGEYDSFLDCFTLTKPLNQIGRAVSSAILGGIGDMVNALDAAEIENMTKKKATGYINKNYNNNWTILFAALCASEGEFNLTYETDSFSDKEFEYTPAEMLKIMNEHVSLTNAYELRNDAGSSE